MLNSGCDRLPDNGATERYSRGDDRMDHSEMMARMISQPVAPGKVDGWDGILSAYADCLLQVQAKLSDADVTRFLAVGALVFRSCCQEEARQRWTAEELASFHSKRQFGV